MSTVSMENKILSLLSEGVVDNENARIRAVSVNERVKE